MTRAVQTWRESLVGWLEAELSERHRDVAPVRDAALTSAQLRAVRRAFGEVLLAHAGEYGERLVEFGDPRGARAFDLVRRRVGRGDIGPAAHSLVSTCRLTCATFMTTRELWERVARDFGEAIERVKREQVAA